MNSPEETAGSSVRPPRRRSLLRRSFRVCWRCARTFAVILVLLIAAALVHLHNVGLPDSLKQMLVERLRDRGWEMEYSRLRFRWMKGLVGEDLHFKRLGPGQGPNLFIEQVEFRLNRDDLKNFIFTPDSLLLRNGRCLWTFNVTNERPQTVTLEDVQGELRYTQLDELDLTALTARLGTLAVRVETHLTNASYLRQIRWPQRSATDSPTGRSTEQILHEVSTQLNRCRLGPGSAVELRLGGDVKLTNSFNGELSFKFPKIDSPWLDGSNVVVWSKFLPPASFTQPFKLQWRIEGVGCVTPWGKTDQLHFTGLIQQRINEPIPSSGELAIKADHPHTPWVSGTRLSLNADFIQATNAPGHYWTHLLITSGGVRADQWQSADDRLEGRSLLAFTNLTPVIGELSIKTETPSIPQGRAARLEWSSAFSNPETNFFWVRTNLPSGVATWKLADQWWEKLGVVSGSWKLGGEEISAGRLALGEVALEGKWQTPNLSITRLHSTLNRGALDASVALNISNRQATAFLTNTSDAHLLAPLLGTNAQRWLQQYGWKQPPWVRAEAEIRLPQWSNFTARASSTNWSALAPIPWAEESIPTFRLRGNLKVGEGDYRGVTFSSATLQFLGSNQVWYLPNIHANRPEGEVDLEHFSNEVTRDYFFRIKSRIDPAAIRPLLSPSGNDALDLFRFAQPPLIEAEVYGRWRVMDRLGVRAQITARDLSFRGETASKVQIGNLTYTNRLFRAWDLQLDRPEGTASVAQVWFDLQDQKLRLTNVVSRVAVEPVLRAIGPKVAETMQDYEFSKPPLVHLNGVVDTVKKRNENDLHFLVDGGTFHWKLFYLPRVVSRVDWVKDSLDLQDFSASFYEGEMVGAAHFDFSKERGTDFRFDLEAKRVSLSPLMKDISSKSNVLEGILDCTLSVTNANTRDKFTWNGFGRGELTNGLIWDIPVFAVVSPVLNTFSPGLGNSRARHASGSFVISNGVVMTPDLDIRANAMRMKSSGSVDFDKRVNARMEAELLRDMPGIGFLVSKVFWPVSKLFEFKITGTLDHPKTDQLYMVPRILLAPFHPFRTLKELFPSDSKDPKDAKDPKEKKADP